MGDVLVGGLQARDPLDGRAAAAERGEVLVEAQQQRQQHLPLDLGHARAARHGPAGAEVDVDERAEVLERQDRVMVRAVRTAPGQGVNEGVKAQPIATERLGELRRRKTERGQKALRNSGGA